MSSSPQVRKIYKNNFNVGSGVETVIDSKLKTELNDFGQYVTNVKDSKLSRSTSNKLRKVLLNSDASRNESQIAKQLFAKDRSIKHNDIIGYYHRLYAGYVSEGSFRENGSSGGFVSWLAGQLLKEKKIDGFIHVQKSEQKGLLFEYRISRNISQIKQGAKSRYYPVELSRVLAEVKKKPGRYAVLGIPEIITELRLLADVDPIIKERIKYYLGLVCGHQKSTKYAEAMAWQFGIKPGDLECVDFRVKRSEGSAIEYDERFVGNIDGKKTTIVRRNNEPFVGSWAHGFFKANFSDFTDNVFNETADVTFGDAWLTEYIDDPAGTNIIIVRNAELDKIIQEAKKEKKVKIDEISEEMIVRSQSGGIHHMRDELPYRLHKQGRFGRWSPSKRVQPSNKLPLLRKRVQNVRQKIAQKSHVVYKEAVRRDDWSYFEKRMQKYINKYNRYYELIVKQADKGLVYKIRNIIRPRTRLKYLKHKLRIRTRARLLGSRVKSVMAAHQNKKKDGLIVTITGNFNYGNIIQRYALKRFLKKNNLEFDSFKVQQSVDNNGVIYRNTVDFVNKYISNKEFDTNKSFGYRNYVVGSDQLWRNWYGGDWNMLGVYYLNFLGDKKANRISYAASFGVDNLVDAGVNDSNAKSIGSLLGKFSAISVREKSGIKLVNQLSDSHKNKIKVVLDPTMLLAAEDYSALIDSAEGLKKTSPIFYYIINNINDESKLLNKISKTRQEKIDGIHGGTKVKSVLPPVEQWLKGFRDANFVVTNSFHGAVFSIINGTDFIVIANEANGLTRLKTLMESLGIEGRIISEDKPLSVDYENLPKIDWTKVSRTLEILRKDSGNWLLRNIEGKGKGQGK
ncbi:polysaccharide pyruvyl transferase family protein [Candidatus Saccharibacteria bacterium]|nr:polysaccharide pyruvyl transferase family protein [Candidatus Saccharibacteria bacterium]